MILVKDKISYHIYESIIKMSSLLYDDVDLDVEEEVTCIIRDSIKEEFTIMIMVENI